MKRLWLRFWARVAEVAESWPSERVIYLGDGVLMIVPDRKEGRDV